MFYLLRPILFPNLSLFSGLCSLKIPRYFSDFASNNMSDLTEPRGATFIHINMDIVYLWCGSMVQLVKAPF